MKNIFLLFLMFSFTLAIQARADFDDYDNDQQTSPQPQPRPPRHSPNNPAKPGDDAFNNGLGQGIGQAIGEVIGEQIRHDIIRNMTSKDRLAYLNAQRMALRADLLRRYAFAERGSSIKGYVRSLREGEDKNGNYCREYEADLITNLSRQYFVAVACLIEDQWIQVPANKVDFAQSNGPGTSPDLPGGGGGWLPPLPRN